MHKWSFLLLGITIGFTATLNVSAEPNDEPQVDFVDSIQPILKRSCYSCHAADKQEGGLRLDHRNSVISGGDSGPIVVKQRPADSLMFQLIAISQMIHLFLFLSIRKILLLFHQRGMERITMLRN